VPTIDLVKRFGELLISLSNEEKKYFDPFLMAYTYQ